MEKIIEEKILDGTISGKSVSELLQLINDLDTEQKRITALRNNRSKVVRSFLYHTYNTEKITFDIAKPELEKLYKSCKEKRKTILDPDLQDINLSVEYKYIPTLVNKDIDRKKRLRRLEQWFYLLHENEVKLIIAMFDHSLVSLYPNLTKSFIVKAMPDLFTTGI